MERTTSLITYQPPSIRLQQQQEHHQLLRAQRRRRRRRHGRGGAVAVAAVAAAAAAALACAGAAALHLLARVSRRHHRRRGDGHQPEQQEQQRRRPLAAKKSSKGAVAPAAAASARLPPRLPATATTTTTTSGDPNVLPEHAAAIPASTLRPLRTLLETVYALRGWRGGGYHYERAWERALDAAAAAGGGGWALQFDARREGVVTPEALRALAGCLDDAFFGGALHGRIMRRLWEGTGGKDRSAAAAARAAAAAVLAGEKEEEEEEEEADAPDRDAAAEKEEEDDRPKRRRGRPRAPPRHSLELAYVADPLHWPQGGYVAAYDPARHLVRVSRRSWALKKQQGIATPYAPLSCEGWRAESLLSALAHSLAHELVHAMVAACFPRMERAEQSYLGDDGARHGAAFALLNRALFGHTSDSLEMAAPRAARR